jgi:hypothetical protein
MDCVVERCSNAVLMERTENAQSQGPEFLVRGGGREQRDNYFTKMRGLQCAADRHRAKT